MAFNLYQPTNKNNHFFILQALKKEKREIHSPFYPKSQHPFIGTMKFTLNLSQGSTLHSDLAVPAVRMVGYCKPNLFYFIE
jgi:hypothetical protein